MERQLAVEELKGRLTNKNLIKHSLAVEAIMRSLAEYHKDEVDKWGLAGLLHDIDYDKTAEDPSKHSIVGAEILEDLGVEDFIVYAVKAHNDYHGIERKRKIDKALYAADPVSGLITASALILPSKKLEDVTVEFLVKRFNEKGFAKGANRNQIMSCSEIGMTLEEFLGIALDAMRGIAGELEL
ncbi:MAG TPA: HDIG domain-containing protein [Clostridia bacterium]|nr:HDIG domain-containing protein [Clostridia bacterium]